ncbi:MAG: S-layer protein, partial [Candidatus Micrarchaeia archaeon]
MKGVNASRIAAIAATTVVLASSAIAAGVMYENVELVNPNGQPTAKIVVGSGAQISDGVAAANIAAVLANYAYKSSTLTAAIDGAATCTSSGELSGAGTCEVSNKKVTIEITLPGQLANAHQFKTLITDTIDKTLENRINTRSEDNYPTFITTNDVNADGLNSLSPLRGYS